MRGPRLYCKPLARSVFDIISHEYQARLTIREQNEWSGRSFYGKSYHLGKVWVADTKEVSQVVDLAQSKLTGCFATFSHRLTSSVGGDVLRINANGGSDKHTFVASVWVPS